MGVSAIAKTVTVTAAVTAIVIAAVAIYTIAEQSLGSVGP
jgi:hypothetical protein